MKYLKVLGTLVLMLLPALAAVDVGWQVAAPGDAQADVERENRLAVERNRELYELGRARGVHAMSYEQWLNSRPAPEPTADEIAAAFP